MERTKEEVELRQLEWRLRQFVEQSPIAVVMLDKEMNYIFVSEKWLSDFHLKIEEVRGKNHYDVFPDIPPHWREVHRRCLRGAIEKSKGEIFHRADGALNWVRWEVRPWYETEGNIGGILIFSEDITEIMRTQSDLASANTRIRTILDSTSVALWAIDSHGMITLAQGKALELSGIKNSEILGRSVFEVYRDWPVVLSAVRKALMGHSSTLEFLLGEIWFEIHLQAVPEEDRKRFQAVAVSIDITERKRSEDQLRQTELQLTTTFNLAAVGMAHVGIDGRFLKVNQKLCDIVGYSEADLLKLTFQEMTHPEDVIEDVGLTQQLLEGKISSYSLEKRYVRKNGSIVWANLTVSLVRFLDKRPNYFISVIEDIHEKVENRQELQRLTDELELRVKERTAELELSNHELEQFAYVASHDLREPLRVIGSYTQLFEKKLENLLDPNTKKYMGYIIDSVKRMDQLITDLLAYSRVGRSGVAEEEINTKEVVDAVLANLRKSMSETEVDIRVGELPRLFCNRSQLIQLFQNLIGNAIKYRSPSRKIQVEIEAVETEKEWRFSVKDNGIGIEPRFKDRIFLMFQRLHHRSEYAGTGIGLAICKKIVESYGGRIWVESVLGKGATFFFTFPSAPRGSNVGLAVRPIWQRPTHGRSDSAG